MTTLLNPSPTPKKYWRYRGGQPPTELNSISPQLIEAANGSPVLATLFLARGLKTPGVIREFLDLEGYKPASGLELPDMELGVARILHAIETQEPVLIFGDFDVDGITGTAVLVQTLKHLGANVSYYIPDRATEGHGLNTAALIRLVSARRIKLVITTDTGITNFNEVSLLNGLKVDTIVTDHHELPENLPPSLANINPKLLLDQTHPLALLAGVGVAFKLCELLLEAKDADPTVAHSLLDLAAVGTVADLASLHRDNRDLVYRGVKVLNQRQRLGLREILEQAGVPPERPLSSETIGFTIGPRLNALGRLEKAGEAVELLTTDDPERARVIAAKLEALNRRRQELCEQTVMEAEQAMRRQGLTIGIQPGDQRAIILASPDWNPGIIGIVASRLIEKFHVPVFLMVVEESKGEVRSSARSIDGFHLHDQLAKLERYFLHFGGHSGAAGFALKLSDLDDFKRDLYALCQEFISEEMLCPLVEMDAQLQWSQLNNPLVELVQAMAPFGKDNPAPRFLLSGVRVGAQRALGNEGQHLKLILTEDGSNNAGIEAMLWRAGNRERFDPNLAYDFVVAPEINTFNGQSKVQLIVEADRPSQGNRELPFPLGRGQGEGNTPEPSPLTPLPEGEGEMGGLVWIDHRQRNELERFVGDLLLAPANTLSSPEEKEGRGEVSPVLFYHEGQAPKLAALRPGLVCNREYLFSASNASLCSVDTLIFWDLPPDPVSLIRILETLTPKTIHWAGGKYRSVPIYPAEQAWMKLLNQTVRRLCLNDASQVWINPQQLAFQLATAPSVILTGLMALQRLGLASIKIPDDAPPDPLTGAVQFWVKPLAPTDAFSMDDLAQSIEWLAFRDALKSVGSYRDWLLKAPLTAIKASCNTK